MTTVLAVTTAQAILAWIGLVLLLVVAVVVWLLLENVRRPIAEIDRLFAPLRLAAVGGHGAEIRITPDGDITRSKLARMMRVRIAAMPRPRVMAGSTMWAVPPRPETGSQPR